MIKDAEYQISGKNVEPLRGLVFFRATARDRHCRKLIMSLRVAFIGAFIDSRKDYVLRIHRDAGRCCFVGVSYVPNSATPFAVEI